MNSYVLIVIAALYALLLGCSVDQSPSPGLYYTGSSPLKLSVGDSIRINTFEKIALADARGRKITIPDYDNVSLISNDTAKVRARENFLVALAQTENSVQITATDNNYSDFTVSFDVEIEAGAP